MGLDIRELGGSKLSYRRLRLILENSPRDSAFSRSYHGEPSQWSVTDHLLANVIDLLQIANWQRAGKGAAPKPFPRPTRPANRSGKTIAEAKAWFERKYRGD
jgi:hypothetical protein